MAWHGVSFSTGEREAPLVSRVPAAVGQHTPGHGHQLPAPLGMLVLLPREGKAVHILLASPGVTQLGHCFSLAGLW